MTELSARSNAISFWSRFHTKTNQNSGTNFSYRNGHSNGDHQAGTSPTSCDAPTTTATTTTCSSNSKTPQIQQTIIKNFLTRRRTSSNNKSFGASYCCSKCSNCIEHASSVAKLCRGGHNHHHHQSNTDPGTILMMDAIVASSTATPFHWPLNAWKLIFQFVLTALNVACWYIPLQSKKISDNKLGMSLANAFSGGVFLCLAFGHLIPECVHGFKDSNEATPYMIVLGGYLLIFFVEKVAFDAHTILHDMEQHGDSTSAGNDQQKHHHHSNSHTHDKVDNNKSIINASNENVSSPTNNGDEIVTTASSGRSAVILLGALAVHSILEMMALGLSSTFNDSALLALSIGLHQPAESIALLVAFLKSGLTHEQIIWFLSIFSCMGPIGVALGMIVKEFAAPIVDSIMLAIVAGTFIYVGATEVIPEEWEDSKHKWKKFIALMSGIVTIFAITQYTMTLGH